MKVAGIVAEYNPFHNGHQYHIEETKKLTGADYVIVVMSGDVVQRGAPAFLDKYDRTYCALAGGCDLVLELPAIYSCASAEYFAAGAVSLLDNLGVCDYLSFGSEEGNLDFLQELAQILSEEPAEYQTILRNHLKSGLSYPAAREKSLWEYCSEHSNLELRGDTIPSLQGANNILALEYMKSLKRYNASMEPFTIPRKSAPYHDRNFHGNMASASAIRKHFLSQGDTESAARTIPKETLHSIELSSGFPDLNSLTPYLHSALLDCPDPENILDWDKDLANRLEQIPWATMSFTQIGDALKSKNITHSRIHRALLHLILRIEKTPMQQRIWQNPTPYGRILGFRRESSSLIRAIHEVSTIPLITKPASIYKTLQPEDLWIWEKDLAASRLYQSICSCQFGKQLPSALQRTPVIYR